MVDLDDQQKQPELSKTASNKWFIMPISNELSSKINHLLIKHDLRTIEELFTRLVNEDM